MKGKVRTPCPATGQRGKRFLDLAYQSADGIAVVRATPDPTTNAPFAQLLANCYAVVAPNKRIKQVETKIGQSGATPGNNRVITP